MDWIRGERFWRRRPRFSRWGNLQESGGDGDGSCRWGLHAGSAWQPGSSSAPSTPRAEPVAAPLPPSSRRAGPAAAAQMDSTACSATKGSTPGHESPPSRYGQRRSCNSGGTMGACAEKTRRGRGRGGAAGGVKEKKAAEKALLTEELNWQR